MNYYKNTTQVPNIILDHYLKILTDTELRVLLTIIRKTIGHIDPSNSKKRLEKAWITRRLFSICTGKSYRSISSAVDSLSSQGLIICSDSKGRLLFNPSDRKGALRLFYAVNFSKLTSFTREKSSAKSGQPLPIIKPTIIKPSREITPIAKIIKARVQSGEQKTNPFDQQKSSHPL